MKGACAIVIEDGRIYLSFGFLKRASFKFFGEHSLPFPSSEADFFSRLKSNAGMINQLIKDREKHQGFRTDKIFLQLPHNLANTKVVSDTVPLKSKKRLSWLDISLIKKYLEDKFLDWDEYCIHNISLDYTLGGITYQQPPYGLWAKNLAVRSLLISIKDKLYKEVEDIFDNINREFSGFVSSMISLYAAVFRNEDKPQVIIYCGYANSNLVIHKKGEFIFQQEFTFSLKRLVEKLAKRFFLDFTLAEELFQRYISFKETPYFKEVTIRKDSGYMNLSTQTMNLFIEDCIHEQLADIFQFIKPHIDGDNFTFSFLGSLGSKEGFYGFLKGALSCEVAVPLEQSVLSTSAGCLRYGLSSFLELNYHKRTSWLERILSVYREYF